MLEEISDEIEIDSHRPDPVKDVEQRLASLRGTQSKGDQTYNLVFKCAKVEQRLAGLRRTQDKGDQT